MMNSEAKDLETPRHESDVCFSWSGDAGKVIATYLVRKSDGKPENSRDTVFCKVAKLLVCRILGREDAFHDPKDIPIQAVTDEVTALIGTNYHVPSDVFYGSGVVYIEQPHEGHSHPR